MFRGSAHQQVLEDKVKGLILRIKLIAGGIRVYTYTIK